jgi:hypothetical protein
VAGARQAPGVDQPLQVAQHAGRPIAVHEDAVDEVRARQMQARGREGLAGVLEQALGVVPSSSSET